MVCSTCFSVTTTTTTIFASSLPKNNNNNINSNRDSSNTNKSVSSPASLVPPSLPTQQYKTKPVVPRIKNAKQPSVAEVEKAIGSGIYRDRDPRSSGEKPTLFDKILTNPFGEDEGPVEKKLRETGEWIIDTTEGATRSAGQEILMVLCLWVLPVWILFLVVASGLVKLPFDLPFLDDLIM